MASIRPRVNTDGTMSYHVQVRLKGRPSETASFHRLTDARRWAQRTEAALREDRHFPSAAAKQRTAAELIDRYVHTVLPTKRPNTIAGQRGQLRWWRERIGYLRLADVTPAVIAERRDELTIAYKAGTVGLYLAAISHVFTVAIREWGWTDVNPVNRVTKPRNSQLRVRFLSDDERRRLLEACEASQQPYLYLVVVLALSTGARKMEIMSLRWPDVNLRRGIITLNDTKNAERRALPLTGKALTMMREYSKLRRIDSDLVFPRPDGKKPPDIKPAWFTARAKAGIEDFRFHDLRHTCASYLAMNGASLAEIAEVLGHKTLNMVKRYAHLSEQHTAGVIARMNQAMFGER